MTSNEPCGPSPSPTPAATFEVNVNETASPKAITFGGTATGPIALTGIILGESTFSRDNIDQTTTKPLEEFIVFLDPDSNNLDASEYLGPNVFGINVEGSTTGDTILGSMGEDTILGDAGDDSIDGRQSNDSIAGAAGNDTINGGDGNDTISGGDGDDTIAGDDGNDNLTGGDGGDTITGGDGNDTITGGAGNDTLTGDAGDNYFVFANNAFNNGNDTITDFVAGATKDVFDVGAFLGAAPDATAASSTLGVDITAADIDLTGGDGANVATVYNAAGTISGANIVNTGTATNGEIIINAGSRAFVAVATAADSATANLYYVNGTEMSATLVGNATFAAGTNYGNIVIDNFV